MILYQRVRPAILARQSSILVGVTLTGSTQIVLQALTFWHQPWAMQLVAHQKSIEDPDSTLIGLVDSVLSLAAQYIFKQNVRTAHISNCIIYMCDRFGIPVVQTIGISVGQPTAIGLVSLWFKPQGSLWVNPQREPTARTHRDPCIKRR